MPLEYQFPTPFYTNTPDSEAHFYELQEEIANALVKVPATTSPWYSDNMKTSFKYGDNDNITNHTPKLAAWILKQAHEFTKTDFTITESWYNVFGPGSYMEYHCHPMQDLSGVYYHQTTGKDGLLVFKSDSSGLRNSMFNTSEIGYEPAPGKLILFPAFMEHAVMRNTTTTDRISVTFNLRRVYG
jgi:uncharacterized protein (TIGR02466 family)